MSWLVHDGEEVVGIGGGGPARRGEDIRNTGARRHLPEHLLAGLGVSLLAG